MQDGHCCVGETVMIHTFPSLYSLYYLTILAIFHIALTPSLSVLPPLAIVPAFDPFHPH